MTILLGNVVLAITAAVGYGFASDRGRHSRTENMVRTFVIMGMAAIGLGLIGVTFFIH